MTIEVAPEGKYTVGSASYASSVGSGPGFCSFPKYVGGYQMGDIRFSLTHKPRWWHRLGVRLVLGWKWVDDT